MRPARPTCPDLLHAFCLGTSDGQIRTYLQGCYRGSVSHSNNPFTAYRWPTRAALDAWLAGRDDATLAALSRQEFGIVELSLDVSAPQAIAYGIGRPALMAGR